jgi:uncharacterized membrane protein
MAPILALDIVPNDWPQITLRWFHFVAGVLWIGLLYFFNWVNSAFAPTMDAETKKKVVPQLMPRVLFWFRWGAAVTWLTGVSLAFLLYYHGPYLLATGAKPEPKQWLPAFLGLFVGFLVYDLLAKLLAKQADLAYLLWSALVIGFGCYLKDGLGYSHRATYIHMGAMFGTVMAANVWMRIWPAQRRIVTAVKNGQGPDPKDPPLATLRSRHNTFMSVPLLLTMVSVDQAGMHVTDWQYLWSAVILIGFAVVLAIYKSVPKVKGF